MIDLHGLSYAYPDTEHQLFDGLDLHVDAGDLLLVAGVSGTGKSTLLRVINGLVPHFHGGVLGGTVRVDGRDPVDLGPRGMADLVGFVGQDPEAHFVADTVEDELAFAMENHGLPAGTMAQRIEEVLDQLSIAALRHRQVDQLSGGERQRVAIASVLTLQPEILVLDEPTSQLDPQSAEEVLQAVLRLHHDFGLTVVISEHRLERLLPHVDRMLLLDGSTPRLGDPAEVLRDSPIAPPLVRLASTLGWQPLPLDLKTARRHPGTTELKRRLESSSAPQETTVPTSPPKPAVDVEGLWFQYPRAPREALAGVDLTLDRGRILALLGRNGAGKSTLFANLVGLQKPSRGRIRIHSGDGPLDPARQALETITRVVGFVPQDPGRLLFHDTVREEILFGLRQGRSDTAASSKGPSGEDFAEALWSHCRDWGLEDLMDTHPRDLSTGERQRVALAAVLAADPQILLLDEPTRGLDVLAKATLTRWLRDLRQNGLAVMIATHDVEWVATCADEAAVLGDGRVVSHGPVTDVLTGSPVFSPQIPRLLRSSCLLTVEDVLHALGETP